MALINDVFQAVGSAADIGSNHHSMGGYLLHELLCNHLQSACRADIPNHGYRFCVRCDCRSRSSKDADSKFCGIHHSPYR